MNPAQPVTSARMNAKVAFVASLASVTTGAAPIPIMRVIARLNVGGPAIQVVSLTDRLRAYGYRTTLLRGREGEREGSMDHLAAAASVEPVLVPGLRRELGLHDVRALWHL